MKFTGKRENFSLKHFSRAKSGTIKIKGEAKYETDNVYRDPIEVGPSERVPHPDLLNVLDAFREHVARILGLAKSDGEGGVLGELAGSEIVMVSVSVSGKEDNRGVILSGKRKAFNGAMMAVNTSRIVFGKDQYGYEEEVEELVNRLEDECFEYIVNRKSGQLDAFAEQEKQAKEPAESEA